MIITCPECTTRFNVARERIPQTGAKVRCARCKHVFPVHPPLDTESLATNLPGADLETAASDSPAHEPTTTDHYFTEEPDSAATDPADFSDIETSDSDFDYDRFRELDAGNAPVEEFTFGNDGDEATTAQSDSSTDLVATTSAKQTEQDEAAELTPEPSRGKKPPTAPKSSAFSILIKTMLLLILAVLIGGGALIYIDRQEEIHQTVRQLFGQVSEAPNDMGQISLGTLEGKFLTNEQAGEIFVIRGEAINNFSQPRSAIQVKGVLHDQHGRPLMQKTVFTGNPVSDDELRVLPFEEIEQRMGNQFGKDLSNMKIDPRRSIPFAIVFKDLPQNIAEFSVKVTSSRPTAN